MTAISLVAENAREDARTSAGRFGAQQHTAPELALDTYIYPPLIGGRIPSQVGINVWETVEGAHSVAVFAWGPDEHGEDNADLTTPLAPERTIALTTEQEASLASDDVWATLDEAPVWLRDIVTAELVDRDALHPDKRDALEAWAQERLSRVPGEPFATSFYNDHLLTFEENHPAGTAQDAVDGMYELSGFDDYSQDHPDREAAAAELSRRAFAHLGGILTDANWLEPGDRVELAGLEEYLPQGLTSTSAVVTKRTSGAYGEWATFQVDGEYNVTVPFGARVATEGYVYAGREYNTKRLLGRLVREGLLPAEARQSTSPADVIDAALASGNRNDPAPQRRIPAGTVRMTTDDN